MTHKQPKTKSPQNWRSRSIRQTPKRTEQRGARYVKSSLKKNLKKTWLKRLSSLAAIGALLVVAVGFITLAWFSRDLPEPGGIVQRDVSVSTKIYDRTGETLLYEIFTDQKRTPVKLKSLPRQVVWATIVAEDKAFYSHSGFKFTSIIRSVIINTLRGGRVQGGSTITQQFIKNAVLTPEKSYVRKIKEIILAWQLERKYSKDEILELYLNEIPYGSTAYGIEAASQSFLNKKASDLTIGEAAILAALPNAPSFYSPYGPNRDKLFTRQKFIINNMVDEGYITPEEGENAKNEDIEFQQFNSSIIAPHFVFYVKDILSRTYGERAVEQGGLKVITSLDLYKQDIAQEIISEHGERNEENYQASNAALIALNPHTGEILSMIGSRDFFNKDIDGEVNVTLRPRQPGSSFKPIVYAAGFEKGLSPDTVLFDLNTTFKTELDDYKPKNYNLDENGTVTIRQALGSSLNIPAVKAIYLTGVDHVLNFAQNLGYTTLSDRSRFGLSLVLGGAEVTLLEHAAAYATFAREGIYHKPVAILKVEDKDGKILEEFNPGEVEEIRVFETEIAQQINSILTDNNARLLTFNEANYLTLGSRPVAAKTGTTNDFRDAWTIGYTPSLVTGVWVGNNDNTTMKGKAAGGTLAAPIWNKFMSTVLGDTPIETFNQPPTKPLPNKPMFNGETTLERKVKIDTTTGKLATDYTPKKNIVEKTFMEVHNILHYTNRNNLRGPIPEKPWEDPNYTTWEQAVERWAEENNIVVGTPPTELDNIHLKKDQPTVSLTAPFNGFIVTSNSFDTVFSAEARNGIYSIELYLDNQLVKTEKTNGGSLVNYPINVNLPNKFSNGEHIFKIIVYDSLENDSEASATIKLNLPNNPVINNTITYLEPQNGDRIKPEKFPITIKTSVQGVDKIKKIEFFLLDKKDNSSESITAIEQPSSNLEFSIATSPEKGQYKIYAITTNTLNQLNVDRDIEIEIP